MSLRASAPRMRGIAPLLRPTALPRSVISAASTSRYARGVTTLRRTDTARQQHGFASTSTTTALFSRISVPPPSTRLLTTSSRPLFASPSSSATATPTSPSTTKPISETETETDLNTDPDPEPEPEPNASAYTRFKALSKKYGWWAVGVYFALSTLDFSLCFIMVHSVGAERIEPLYDAGKHYYRVKRYGEEEADRLKVEDEEKREEEQRILEQENIVNGQEGKKQKKSGGSGGIMGKTFWAEVVLAYTIHKTALLPFRAGLTVAWTPKLVGWLTRRGWVGKGGLTRAASHAQGKVRDASDRVKVASDRVKERVKRQP
ncbi:hypothetical protein CI109_105393 [Kwoniella shandongensis]|uniref:Uncharacterized protein n=1 Tax=Kwoniella shandongensis TaxID=1734106 RepID=A0A5M6BRD6_9TREE|nr:uncharacterized protein CI109_006306 [Kwoniella shandongensis]KAA5525327.1 hypothetical protein CI109_006306 [Kwoniella shandongensis]